MTPDFENRYRRVVLRQGEPDRVPLADVTIDRTHKERLLGRPLRSPEDEIEFWVTAGFDFVVAEAGIQMTSALQGTKTTVEAQYALFDYGETERGWVVQDKGLIRTEADFEAFPWPDPDQLDYGQFESFSRRLPPGMKILGSLGKIFTSVWWLMGFEHYAVSLVQNPSLVQRVTEKVAITQLGVLDQILQFDAVGGVIHADDLAYAEALMIKPEHLRQYVFPWFQQLCERIHACDKLAVFHSDGKLDQVMPDLIECGFDAVHPFEPKAMDIVANKRKYGDRICVMGNIDLAYTLTRGTPEEVAAECRQRIRELAPGGGYCLGSSNSIPEYVPYENFQAMLQTVFESGQYPITAAAVGQADTVEQEVPRSDPPLVTSPQERVVREEFAGVADPQRERLSQAVIHGQARQAEQATQIVLDGGVSPEEIFTDALIPAMREVGRRMECSEFFVPDVLLAARAMNASVAVLKPLLDQSPGSPQIGTVVLGTVRGDMHDIGKNLVSLMLQGYGFRVVDLGVDVPASQFVDAVRKHHPEVVGLSALLTTTMLGMQDVIDALVQAGLRDQVKILVGGAPVDERFAAEIGADVYSPNAAAGANAARSLVTE